MDRTPLGIGKRLLADLPLPEHAGETGKAGRGKLPPGFAGPRVFTPHAGEMARLLGTGPEAVAGDREAVAERSARDWGALLVLKGVRTLVSGRGFDVNTAGTPGLGTAGSGDVLAGVIGGLLARGAGPTAAAVRGVHLHALAGEAAAAVRGDDGMIASDVVEYLPDALRALRRPS